jgi:hypothetical protein
MAGSMAIPAAPTGANRTAARRAPLRAVLILTSRWPEGSGRQLGDHGLFGPMVGSLAAGRALATMVQ